MCKNDGELVNHLFVHCPYAKKVWNDAIKLTLLESKHGIQCVKKMESQWTKKKGIKWSNKIDTFGIKIHNFRIETDYFGIKKFTLFGFEIIQNWHFWNWNSHFRKPILTFS